MILSSLSPERKSKLQAILDKNTRKAGPDDCWLYQKTHWKGYGRVGITLENGKVLRMNAHRVAYALHYNMDIPPALMTCHSCDVRDCVNPAHIFLGTAKLNAKDALLKDRRYKRPRGIRLEVADNMVKGMTYPEVTKKYGIPPVGIRRILDCAEVVAKYGKLSFRHRRGPNPQARIHPK